MAEHVILCPTKSGQGFAVVADGNWFYASQESLLDVVNGRKKACAFKKKQAGAANG